MKRIYLLDLSVFAHMANAIRLSQPIQRKRGWIGAWFRANLVSIASLDWDSHVQKSCQSIIAFAIDSKPYWRTEKLREIGVRYKKKKGKTRSRKGLSYTKTALIKEILEAGLPVLGLPTQEADDIAALVSRTKPNDVALRLVTTDNDWCGLIDPGKNIDWYCMHGYPPRYRGCLDHVKASKQGRMMELKSLSDYYAAKQQILDISDNIPAGTVAWATDILHPLPDHDPLKTIAGLALMNKLYANLDYYAAQTQRLRSYSRSARDWYIQTASRPVIYLGT